MKVLIVDDHGIVRQGLKALITRQPDIEVVGEAEDGKTALEVNLREDTVWLSQAQMCNLFDKNKRTWSIWP